MNHTCPPGVKWVSPWKDWIWNGVKIISKRVCKIEKNNSFDIIRLDIGMEFTIRMVFEFFYPVFQVNL